MVTIETQSEINLLLAALHEVRGLVSEDTDHGKPSRISVLVREVVNRALMAYRDHDRHYIDVREQSLNGDQRKAMTDLQGMADQVEKQHWLNIHFRAFRLSHDAWQHHILANARAGSRACNSPAGAVLDDTREDA